MKPMAHRFARAALFIAALGASVGAGAQDYPAKPVRMALGLAVGGGTDVIARVLAQKMSESMGQQIVVDNKPGASGMIASEFVARAPADGYTLLIAPSGPMVFNPVMYARLPYSPVKDFVPLGQVCTFPLIAVVNATTPVKSVRELVDFVKANPARANYAASTSAFQLTTELFGMLAGVKLDNINYKGTNESISAVIAGDVLVTIADTGPAIAGIRGGKLRPLAVTSARRVPAFPDVPTMAEAGYPQLDVQLWVGLFAPAATPAPIVKRLEEELQKALKAPDLQARFNALALTPGGASAAEMGPLMNAEIARWGEVVKRAGIKVNAQ